MEGSGSGVITYPDPGGPKSYGSGMLKILFFPRVNKKLLMIDVLFIKV
jgi:hypothetical protein